MAIFEDIDLLELAIKGKLIGSVVYTSEGEKTVADFGLDNTTDTIILEWTDGTKREFNMRQKYKVDVVDGYVKVVPTATRGGK